MRIEGLITNLFYCTDKGEPMISTQEAIVLENLGIQGDRYQRGTGAYSKIRSGVRQLSIISQEAIFRTNFTPVQTRRNIVTEGLPMYMGELVGIEFRIGQDIVVRGIEVCSPCDRPSALSKIRGFKEAFVDEEGDRGGLRVVILKGGILRVGDKISS